MEKNILQILERGVQNRREKRRQFIEEGNGSCAKEKERGRLNERKDVQRKVEKQEREVESVELYAG